MTRNLVGILRGVKPDEVVEITAAILDAGISLIEVPLNSPDPLRSISTIATELAGRGHFGAGTVLTVAQVRQVADAGGSFIVSPNMAIDVIGMTKTLGLGSYPGIYTPTEAFAALDAGADVLKVFPADMMGPAGLKALRAVLPTGTQVYAVGGADPSNFGQWIAAGADGFGLGSFLYKPGYRADEVGRAAAACVAAYDAALAG